jgi:hypothetical protein
MFGSAELDEESIKYFAKNDFYLADSLAGLEEQIYTCIKCLEKLTCKGGVASEGYWFGFEMLSSYKREFLSLLQMDPLFPVKFAYLLDRSFQNFVKDLGDFYDRERPIRRARKKLEGQQKRDIEAAMSGFKTGSLSQLFLPRSLQSETNQGKSNPQPPAPEGGTGGKPKAGRGSDSQKEKSVPEAWWTANPNPVPGWKIPEGKGFGDFFNSRDAATKPNTMLWPKFKHHDPKKTKKAFLCLKYQCLGECGARCYMAHLDPEKMEEGERKTVDERFKAIYNN